MNKRILLGLMVMVLFALVLVGSMVQGTVSASVSATMTPPPPPGAATSAPTVTPSTTARHIVTVTQMSGTQVFDITEDGSDVVNYVVPSGEVTITTGSETVYLHIDFSAIVGEHMLSFPNRYRLPASKSFHLLITNPHGDPALSLFRDCAVATCPFIGQQNIYLPLITRP
jgi:hypothetical protein